MNERRTSVSSGFTVILTRKGNGELSSNMIFSPSAVSSSGIRVTCVDSFITSTTATEEFAVTRAGTVYILL